MTHHWLCCSSPPFGNTDVASLCPALSLLVYADCMGPDLHGKQSCWHAMGLSPEQQAQPQADSALQAAVGHAAGDEHLLLMVGCFLAAALVDSEGS